MIVIKIVVLLGIILHVVKLCCYSIVKQSQFASAIQPALAEVKDRVPYLMRRGLQHGGYVQTLDLAGKTESTEFGKGRIHIEQFYK